MRALPGNLWVWATLFAHRLPPRPVNLFAVQAGMGSAENTLRCPLVSQHVRPIPSSPSALSSHPCTLLFSIATCLLPYGGTAHKSHAHHIIIQSTGAKQPSSEWIWSVLSGRCMSGRATPTKLFQLGFKLSVHSSEEINNNLPPRNA